MCFILFFILHLAVQIIVYYKIYIIAHAITFVLFNNLDFFFKFIFTNSLKFKRFNTFLGNYKKIQVANYLIWFFVRFVKCLKKFFRLFVTIEIKYN